VLEEKVIDVKGIQWHDQ